MLTVTLANLKLQARQRADMENSTFVSDSELTAAANASAAELLDLLIATNEDYSLSTFPISLVSTVDRYNLPADFYKLRGVDLVLSGGNYSISLAPFNFQERNNYIQGPQYNILGAVDYRYRVQGNQIRFLPIPNGSIGTITLWYIPALSKLVNDSDVLDGVNGFEEYVIVDMAIKMRIKEESDTSELERAKEGLRQRIMSMSASRDAGRPEKVSDVARRSPYEVGECF